MSSLAKKFKKASTVKPTSKKAIKPVDTDISQIRTDIRAKIKKGKAKAKEPEEEKKTTIPPEVEEAIRDSKTRQSLVSRLLSFMQNYISTHGHSPTNIDQNKSRGEFPLLYNHLLYLVPFTSNELTAISADPRFQDAIYLRPNPVIGRKAKLQQEPINILEILEMYNILLAKTPYTNIRSNLLQQLDVFSEIRSRPDFAETILRNDELFGDDDIHLLSSEYSVPNSIIKLVYEYNQLLSSVPHKPRVRVTSQIVGPAVMLDVAESAKYSLKDMRNRLKASRESSSRAALKAEAKEEDDEERKKRIGPPTGVAEDLTEQIKRHVLIYRQSIKVQISTEEKRKNPSTTNEPKDISEQQVSSFILSQENLPYWTFMTDFISSPISQTSTRTLFHKYPEISSPFIRLFQRLTTAQQIEFVTTTFYAFPLEDYPNGPPNSVLSLMVEFYNTNIDLSPTENDLNIDEQLTIIPPDQFNILFKSLSPVQLLRYRSIIFGRFPVLDQDTRISILSVYSAFLLYSEATLGYDEKLSHVYATQKSTTGSIARGIVGSYDFILPFDTATKREIINYLQHNLSDIVKILHLTKAPTPKEVRSIQIPNENGISLFTYTKERLFQHFTTNLPIQPQFNSFLSTSISQVINEILTDSSVDPSNIAEIDIELPEDLTEQLSERLNKQRTIDHFSLSALDLQSQATRLGLNMNIGMDFAKPLAIAKLKSQLHAREITPSEYDETIRQIDQVISAYSRLSKKTGSSGDIDLKNKRRQVAKLYDSTVRELVKAARDAGQEPDNDVIQTAAWKVVIDSGEATPEELGLMKNPYQIQVAENARSRKELEGIVRTMPEALKNSLQKVLDDIVRGLEQVKTENKAETANYYKFVVAVIIWAWSIKTTKDKKTLKQIADEYRSILPPTTALPFIRKILDMLTQKGVTGSALLQYTANYTRKQTILIKNPLVRHTIRRKRRYDQLFVNISEGGTLAQVRRMIPEPLAPHLKECIASHQLKPWLNIPRIDKWHFMVADANGKRRDEMSEKDRIYFNIPRQNEFVVELPSGKNVKKLYFYRPTTAYWIMHCQLHHNESDPISCNLNSLVKTFTDSSASHAQFYELMVLPPVQSHMINGNTVVKYTGDTDHLIFLSKDKSVYERECAWFKNRYTKIQDRVDSLRAKPMIGSDDIMLRNAGRIELGAALSLLRIKYGIQSKKVDGTILEQALYDNLINKGDERFNVYTYLKELYLFLIFIDLTNPIGKAANFFTSLVAQCSEAYYPSLFQQFPDPTHRFPEVFMLQLGINNNKIKEQTRSYLEQKIELLIDDKLIQLIGGNIPSSTEHSIKLLMTKQAGELTTSTPEFSGLTLKNICENSADYKGMDDSWLMYYTNEDKVYCISKLQLASMAQSKHYKFKGISFDPNFVNSFSLYSEFTANEMRLRTEYIKSIVTSLLELPENKILFSQLARYYNLFGELLPDDLSEVGIFDKLKPITGKEDAYIVMIITNRLNEVLDVYISTKVLEEATQFIKSNNNQLRTLIDERYTSYHKSNTLSLPPATNGDPLLSGPVEEEYQMMILGPAVDVVEKHINITSNYIVSDNDRRSILELVSDLVHGEPMVHKRDSAEWCKCEKYGEGDTNIPPYTTIAQVRQGLDTKTKYLKFCSSKCFSAYKISEPSRDDVDLGRLQNAIIKVTERYLDYTQMTYWARFPDTFQLPKDATTLNTVVDNFAKIKGIPTDEVRAAFPTLSKTENALGIFTFHENGIPLSNTELWDRIRIHPMFVPSIIELSTKEKYEALVYLARKFNVVIYSSVWDDAELYYSVNSEELRDVWKELRAKPAFEKVLYSTVKSFDPYQEQKVGIRSFTEGTDMLNYVTTSMQPQKPNIQNRDIFTSVYQFIRPGIQTIPNLADMVIDGEQFKKLRDDIISSINRQFPTLLKFDQRQNIRVRNLKTTLQYWFDNHRTSVINKSPLVANFDAQKITKKVEVIKKTKVDGKPGVYNETDASFFKDEHILSSQELINELGQLCNTVSISDYTPSQMITAQNFSKWTLTEIKKNSNPATMSFALNFYPLVINTYKCSDIRNIEQRHTQFLFNLEKINSIIDDILTDIIDEQQRPSLPHYSTGKKPNVFARLENKMKRARQEEDTRAKKHGRKALSDEDLRKLVLARGREQKQEEKGEDLDTVLQNLSLSSIPSLQVSLNEPEVKTRLQILEQIKRMREQVRKSFREKNKPKLTGKIVWKKPEVDQLTQEIEQAFADDSEVVEDTAREEELVADTVDELKTNLSTPRWGDMSDEEDSEEKSIEQDTNQSDTDQLVEDGDDIEVDYPEGQEEY